MEKGGIRKVNMQERMKQAFISSFSACYWSPTLLAPWRHGSSLQDAERLVGESDMWHSECFLLSPLNSRYREPIPCSPNLALCKDTSWHGYLDSRAYRFPASQGLLPPDLKEDHLVPAWHLQMLLLALSVFVHLGSLGEQQHPFLWEGGVSLLNAETPPRSRPVSWWWWWKCSKCDQSPGVTYGSSHWPYRWSFTSSCT